MDTTLRKPVKAIFLDRDGTINVDTGYVYRLSDFALMPNVIDGLKLLRDAGFTFFIVTNQSGIARGLYTEHEYRLFNQHLIDSLALHDIHIKQSYYCPFLPDAPLAQYRKDSSLRKPSPGMLELAASEYAIDKNISFMIGGKETDTEAGKRFNIRSILLRPKNVKTIEDKNASFIANDLVEAAHYIIHITQ
jgi:D-glycero-D-manno-heptose 1,7-bisphosphate phosphatase